MIATISGCGPTSGGGGGGGSDAGGISPDTAPSDSEPPEIRDIQLNIKGEFSSKATLTAGDATRILPVAADAEFTVFAQDNETARENLDVQVVDASGAALDEKMSSVNRGLWRLTVEIAPDSELRVEITDEAGNTTTSMHSLRLASRAEALAAVWKKRFYSNEDEPSVTEEHTLTVESGGEWNEDVEDYKRGGEYRVEGDLLVFQETFQRGGSDKDTDESTIEQDRVSEFYVDDEFFSLHPWTREDSGSGIATTWKRSWTRYEHDAGNRTEGASVEETLQLEKKAGGKNTWKHTREETPKSGSATTSTRSGTWKTIELTTNYGENLGTFLVRTTTHEDGNEVQMAKTTTESDVFRLDHMLISPYTRSSASGS